MKKKQIQCGCVASGLVLLICLIAFSSVILKNDSILIFYGDSVEQMYTFLLGYWQKFHIGDFSFFEWSNGLGANVFTYVFYNLFSPFNLVYLLFPKEMISNLMLYVGILKLMVLAFFSSLWLSKLFKQSKVCVIGSLLVTFSGWVLFYFHYHFLDSFVMYPLVLYFTESYLQHQKKGGLIVSIFALTVMNYYFMYLLVPFLWLYALFRYLVLHKETTLLQVLKEAGLFLCYTLLGIGMGACVLLPCAFILSTSERFTSQTSPGFFVGVNDAFKIVTSLFSPVLSRLSPSNFILDNRTTYQGWGGGASLYTALFSLVFAPLFLLNEDVRKRNIMLIFFGLVFLFMMCPYFYLLFQGTYDTRFFYMGTFLIVYFTCEGLQEYQKSHFKFTMLNLCLVFVGVIFCLMISHHYGMNDISQLKLQFYLQVVLATATFIGLIGVRRFGITVILLLVLFESLFSTRLFLIYNEPINVNQFTYESGENELTNSILASDDGFYRVMKGTQDSRLANDTFANQVPGLSFYWSVYGHEQQEYLNRLISKWSLSSLDNKYRLNNLAGVKYWYTEDGNDVPLGFELNSSGTFYVNRYFVELGYKMNQVINAEFVFSLPYLLQDRILQEYLVLEDVENTEYELHDDLVQLIEWGIPSELVVDFGREIKDAIVYLENFGMPVVDMDLYRKNELISTHSFYQYNYTDLYISEDQPVDKIVIHCEDVYYTGSNVNVYLVENVSETERVLSEKRKAEAFYDVEFHNDVISASITLDAEGYVFTQIPYDSGWTVVSDDRELDIIKANGGFCAVYLDEGTHHLVFRYRPPWLKEGILCSLVCWSVFALLMFNELRKNNSR